MVSWHCLEIVLPTSPPCECVWCWSHRFLCPLVYLRRRFEMDREPAEARFCAECNRCHSAEEGDLWAESSMLGLRITYFACMDGKVYDITGELVNWLHQHDLTQRWRSFDAFAFFWSRYKKKNPERFLLRVSWPHCDRSLLILLRCCCVF